LNLFKNTLDVDGARALRDLLKVNTSITFLEIGHNRIRQKGLEAISEGILGAKDSKLKSLGLRMNFINDSGFQRFFDEVVFSNMSKLDSLFITQNNFSDYKALKISKKIKTEKLNLFVDHFEKIGYQDDENLEKTLWFHLPNYGESQLASVRQQLGAFNKKATGLLRSRLRVKCGRHVAAKKTRQANVYMFAEFVSDKSIANVTQLLGKRKILHQLGQLRAYKAGTNTFVNLKRSKRN
jgi:hypothetical protein